MNHELNLEPGTSAAGHTQPLTAPLASAREPYSAPRLTSYGRFQHITGASLQGTSDEAVVDSGDTTF